jgi:hypothetical protein
MILLIAIVCLWSKHCWERNVTTSQNSSGTHVGIRVIEDSKYPLIHYQHYDLASTTFGKQCDVSVYLNFDAVID